ncbi:MAG: hypothetical protein M4D80_25070 [Myxococcota bacterium]|nr:hypothetical protein [Myxococcota bacterium]
MRFLIALVLITSACKKKESAANPCDAAVERGVDQTIAKRRAGATQPMTPAEQEVPKKLKVALAKSCAETKWAADVIDCYKTADDIATCKEKLTPEQRAAYTQAAMGVMQSAGGSGGMPPHGMPPGGMPSGGMPPGGGSMGAPPAGSGSN